MIINNDYKDLCKRWRLFVYQRCIGRKAGDAKRREVSNKNCVRRNRKVVEQVIGKLATVFVYKLSEL